MASARPSDVNDPIHPGDLNALSVAASAVEQLAKRGYRRIDPPDCTKFEHYPDSDGNHLAKRGYRCLDPPDCTKFEHYPDSDEN